MAPKQRQQNLPNRKQKKTPFFKKHHGMLAVLIVCGWFVPPLAVVIRFGIGFDFFLNVILTALAYIPGHVHNFYLQNIRNNQGRGRTPKWALKAGLIQDDTEYVKSTRQWGNRYGERNARNSYDDPDRPYEDEFGNPITPVERFIENHGIKPAQPAGGFGPKGNDIIPVEERGDLLSGLPDEDRDARKRNKRMQRSEYGAGLDEQDRWEDEQAARSTAGYGGSNGRGGGGLLDDLEDPDAAYRPARRSGTNLSSGSGEYGARAPAPKKSGRSKKSERYGIKSDHADLNSRSGSSSKSNGRRAQVQNDQYDIVDDRRGSRRSTGDEDFMNHQF